MTAEPTAPVQTHMPVKDIIVTEGANARQNGGGIDELAASIDLMGILVPLIVTSDGHLIAGHRRLAAARKLKLEHVPVVVQGKNDRESMAAVENIARQQLSPTEEADAIDQMLKAGYSTAGAAQALGMSERLVALRAQILQLPPDLRVLWGPGGTAKVSTVPHVIRLLEVCPKLAPALLKYDQIAHDDDNTDQAWYIDGLATDPGRYLHDLYEAMATQYHRVKGMPKADDFIHLTARHSVDPTRDKLGTAKLRERYQTAKKDASAKGIYDLWHMSVEEADVDAAIAAGAGIEIEHRNNKHRIILSKSWLVTYLPVMVERYEKAVAAAKSPGRSTGGATTGAAKKAAAKEKAGEKLTAADRQAIASAEKAAKEREQERDWRDRGRGTNLDLGRALLDQFSTVELTPEIARFFAETSLGWRPIKGGYARMDERFIAGRLAAGGLRYVFADWQTEVKTPTKANPAKTRIDYLDIDKAQARLWKWFDAAREPGEILGRALIIHAAAMWAIENVLPQSQRQLPTHRNQGGRYVIPQPSAQILRKLTERKLPASIKRLIKEMQTHEKAA